ncbi:MAG TPA: hypothetical protein DD727_07225 [Clostridiales bacterium]|nr:hypothetical protein [Clostridiales bacterium]
MLANNKSERKNWSIIRKWVLGGIPVIILLSSLMHDLYEWSGNNLIVGFIAPVNESIWEHLKMSFLPTLLWWTTGYFFFRRSLSISPAQWFTPMVVSLYLCPLFITSFYYTYTGAFGIQSLFLDILSLVLGVTAAQIIALHLYRYARFNRIWLYLSMILILLMFVTFIVFTLSPPDIPLFKYS